MSAIVVPPTAGAEIERALQDAILNTSKVKPFCCNTQVLPDRCALMHGCVQAASLTQFQSEIFRRAADNTSVSPRDQP